MLPHKTIDMKRLNYIAILGIMLSAFALEAQFDDLYYDPDNDDLYYFDNDYYDDGDDYDYFDDDEYYDDYGSSYYDDYDYYYTSRLRRFNRSYVRLGFYNSWACNSLFYDPWDFYAPYYGYGGSYFSIGIGNPYFNINYNPWGYWGGFNSWAYYDPWRPNYGWAGSGWGWGGGFGYNSWNPYCPPFYGGGNGFYGPGYVGNVIVTNSYNQGSNAKGVYYGSRRGGSTSSSVKGVRSNPRIQNTDERILSPGALSEDSSVRATGIADAQTPRRTPRRTSAGINDDLAVSRIDDRPGRRSAIDGTRRGESRNSVSRISDRPSRRSLNPSGQVPRSYDSSRRATRRSDVPSSTRSSSRSATTRQNRSSTRSATRSSVRSSSPTRSSTRSSSRSSFNRSSSPSSSMSRSSSRSSSTRSSSPRSSSSSSRSSSPRRNG